jgi:hypothetical protein
MPTYCYTNEATGHTIERFFGMHEDKPKEIVVADCDGVYRRDYSAETKALQTESCPGWPMAPCTASGVQPYQAQELRDHLKKSGVPTEVTSQGDPIYRSKAHRTAALKARQMHDRASFD